MYMYIYMYIHMYVDYFYPLYDRSEMTRIHIYSIFSDMRI